MLGNSIYTKLFTLPSNAAITSYLQPIVEASNDFSAVVVFTHGGATTYKAVDAAVYNARSVSNVPVYHLFGHHHAVSEVGEHSEFLLNTYGMQYTASGLKGFLIPGIKDSINPKYAEIEIFPDGSLNAQTIIGDNWYKFDGLPNPYQYPLYWLGAENVTWVPGESIGEGVQSKQDNHLYLEAGADAVARRAWVTDIPIDLTNYKKLYIDWDGEGVDISGTDILIVSIDKMGNQNVYNAVTRVTGPFDRRLTSINISGLDGQYYIRVHVRDGSSTSLRKAVSRIYRVWLE